MVEDFESCLRAVRSKDARFDGWFFTGVVSTGIYCRPSCPVVPPQPRNIRFHPSAAAAQAAGLRACKRCRPDAAPGSPEWNNRADVVGRAMRPIADGVVDRDGVPGLARRLGYSTRQLERSLRAELGAGPLALARAQRAQTARLLMRWRTSIRGTWRCRRRGSVRSAPLVAALASGEVDLDTGSDWSRSRARLAALPGLGPWTVETIAMRALGDSDAFLPTDLGVRVAVGVLGLPASPGALTAHSLRWRPWRAYAVQYLWSTGEHAINRLPGAHVA